MIEKMRIHKERRLSLITTMKVTLLVGFPLFIFVLILGFVFNLSISRREVRTSAALLKNDIARNTATYIREFERQNFYAPDLMGRYGTLIENRQDNANFIINLTSAMTTNYTFMSGVKWFAIVDGKDVFKQNSADLEDSRILDMLNSIYEDTDRPTGRIQFHRDEESGGLYVARAIFGSERLRFVGFIFASIDIALLDGYFESLEKETGNHYSILSDDGSLLYELGARNPRKSYESDTAPLGDYDLMLRQDLDIHSQLRAMHLSFYGMLGITLFGLGMIFLFQTFFLNDIQRQIELVLDHIRAISDSDFAKRNDAPAQAKEIAEISTNLNEMAMRIESLISKNEKAVFDRQQIELELVQAKYAVLQSQINPHFLYNVLESINGQALLNDDAQTADMICHLADFFRGVLDYTGKRWSIDNEISFIRNYLELYTSIYPRRLSVQYDIDSSALGEEIPSFLLQPLVENSIVHGLEKKIGRCTISVSCIRREHSLEFVIRDDGAGMGPERLAEVRTMLHGTRKGRVGLPNVVERLRLEYGNRARIQISSEKGRGPEVQITIEEVS